MSATAVHVQPRTMWCIYAWPGGRWLVTAWSLVPGQKEEHGPLIWGASLEAVRAHIPDGFKRFDPTPADLERNPALKESWL